jgi:CheY-like chemotaxis protein
MVLETPPGRPEVQAVDRRFAVLIADDDRGTRETLGEALEQQGYRTLLVADGTEAVEVVQVELVHLILFDLHMPRLSGLDAWMTIRHLLQTTPPAVLMTADATSDLIRRAFQAQVFSVVPKPVQLPLVVHTLGRALRQVYSVAPPGLPAS